jgi:hypothetical protein
MKYKVQLDREDVMEIPEAVTVSRGFSMVHKHSAKGADPV